MKKFHKLVRDRIPEIIEADGFTCKTHIADELNELEQKLGEKLVEEVTEFIRDPSAEEMADILEVLESVRKFHKIDLTEIKNVKVKKKEERGGFDKKIILESTEKKKS